ncbi:MAG: sugar transferase [Gammaproteobacteria bacterium]|nr:sugar transferase [Gammaproteobacteria bacterium]
MFLKRVIDLLLATTALVALSPLLLVVFCLVLIFIGRPALFRQQRIGFRCQPFTMYKFRTMSDLRAADGTLLSDAERLTATGRFLRSTSLDELPELWNVLRGEMSLIGPRPLLVEYLPLYSKEQNRRHEVLPGITGWAQVNGRNSLSWEDRFALDVWYVDHRTIWLDLRILLMTFGRIFRRQGISAAGNATMPKFTGSKD